MGKRYSKTIDQSNNERIYDEAPVVVIEETFGYAAFTDGGGGGGTEGTYQIKTGSIPVQAIVLFASCTDIVGFANDSSATVEVGDGSDPNRYSTGTPSVFTTATDGVALGACTGIQYHAAAKNITVTVTTGANFTSVNAGQLTIRVYYLL